MKKKEYKVGETFQFGLMKLRCEKRKDDKCDTRCVFYREDFCYALDPYIGGCEQNEREDNQGVFFVKIGEEQI